MLECEIRT